MIAIRAIHKLANGSTALLQKGNQRRFLPRQSWKLCAGKRVSVMTICTATNATTLNIKVPSFSLPNVRGSEAALQGSQLQESRIQDRGWLQYTQGEDYGTQSNRIYSFQCSTLFEDKSIVVVDGGNTTFGTFECVLDEKKENKWGLSPITRKTLHLQSHLEIQRQNIQNGNLPRYEYTALLTCS